MCGDAPQSDVIENLTGVLLMGDFARREKPIPADGDGSVAAASKIAVVADGSHEVGPAIDTVVDPCRSTGIDRGVGLVGGLSSPMSLVLLVATVVVVVPAVAVAVLAPTF